MLQRVSTVLLKIYYSELKDNLAGHSIEGEIPELLKQILARDPDAFKSGSKHKGKYNKFFIYILNFWIVMN